MDSNLVAALIWLALIVILVVIEVSTFNLITIWFAIAGIVPMLLAYNEVSLPFQLISFILISIALLLVTRPFLNKMKNGKTIKTNYEAIVNQEGVALESFEIGNQGYIKVNGMEWLAYSDDNIEQGDRIIVNSVSGAKLNIRKK